MKIKRRGFTLIEILIVVVILAILAALILPKLLSQPEKAYIAEASQMLGTMVRQENNQEAWVAVGTTGFSAIGMTNPDTTNWTYTCSTTACKAVRASGSYSGSAILLDNTARPAWSQTAAGGTFLSYTCVPATGCKSA